jgi:hypothetical protein
MVAIMRWTRDDKPGVVNPKADGHFPWTPGKRDKVKREVAITPGRFFLRVVREFAVGRS